MPETVPPSGVRPRNCWICSCDPPKRPADSRFSITMPVIALSIRAAAVRTEPLMTGFSSVPDMSAPIAAGPLKSMSSIPVSRQSVSAAPL